MPQQPPSHDGCRESQTPAASLSCCCDNDTVPTSTPATTIIAEGSFGVVMSVVANLAPTADGLNHGCESTILLTRTRPLFTLFSAFLI